MDCVFCQIVAKKIPSEIVKETPDFLVFKDIHPSAPIHFLIVPKTHQKDISEMNSTEWEGVRQIALELQKEQGLTGFRLATNIGDTAMVEHTHLHFLGGIKKDRNI